MIRPTDALKAEHALVAQSMRVLTGIGRAVRAGAAFPAADCAMVIRFLREFVLASHMQREASVLCPAVAMRGDDTAAAVVGEVMRLHAEVGDLVHSLMWFWEPGDLSAPEREGFAAAVDALNQRFAQLRALEEDQLFPIAEAFVPADDRLEWVQSFQCDRDSSDRWRARIADLADDWAS
ncbi:MAG: hemerythrin domain-containing protein [Planctomycetes bacterium]|nr:hemerythrin domain-containing protein [Planctomycetota bacterium]